MTAPWVTLLVALAGGIGAAARFIIDSLIAARSRGAVPLGTLVINVSGSFLLGLLAGWATAAAAPPDVRLVLGTGLLGGFTTFSTASVELVRLVRDDRRWTALGLAAGMLVLSLAAAAAGLWLGSR